MKKKTTQIMFTMTCSTEKQLEIINKELKARKLITGQSYAFIIIEALYNLRSKK
jgi:hypothetical protein